MPPGEIHAYRVTCSYGHFAGWGNEPQLQQIRGARQPVQTAVAVGVRPAATLKDFL